jgi:hypothetical protein
VDAQTDVYSLGVVLYELLTGGVPYDGDNFVTVALRHVNEPVPSVLERRPDTPPRVALAVERAMAKSPDDRFSSMDELVDELETCLADLDPISEEATMIARRPVVPAAQRGRPTRRRRRIGVLWPIAAVVGVLGIATLAALGALALRDDGSNGPSAATGPIQLKAIRDHDPFGDNMQEHPEDVPKATDGSFETYWTTENYGSLEKPGVGIVLDAGREVEPSTIAIRTDTSGYTAHIRAGESDQGPFRRVSPGLTVTDGIRFNLSDGEARYFVIWITAVSGAAHVNEVTAR